MDTVKRGPMLRQVRGPGTLVVESSGDSRSFGRNRRPRRASPDLEPGALVKPDSIILEMSNPELERDALDAESQALKAGQAELMNSRVRVPARRSRPEGAGRHGAVRLPPGRSSRRRPTKASTRKASIASCSSSSRRCAPRSSRRATPSRRSGSRSPRTPRRRSSPSRRRRSSSSKRLGRPACGLRWRRSRCGPESRAFSRRSRSRSASRSTPGNDARQGRRSRTKLKAQLKIAETQARDIAIGQPAAIDTRNGIVAGQGRRASIPAVAERHGHRGRGARGRAAAGRASGPLGRRHDRARPAQGRALRRPPGVRPGEEPRRPLPRRTRTATRRSASRSSSERARSTPSRSSRA